ncbi:putative peroxisomal carrier protein [Rhizodiscina lignyota]|uniref:Peroxisomal carrier protein n=1 Tax=Rhizodiscina lignyota TaxID=1504668 RepID=A0A9P4IR68_9PEZI|nr:putative peroxisomal carrier protein [Rhizodiscina lignyota]
MANQSSLRNPPPIVYAISGSVALVVANSLLFPIDTVRTKLQAQSKQDASQIPDDAYYNGFIDAVIKIVRTEGFPGLYAALPGSILSNAFQGYAFNYWHSLLRQTYMSLKSLPQPPGTTAELACAYGAGVLSVLFTIPLSVVTTRQQTTPPNERKGILGTAKEIVDSDDGITGLWKGFRASLLLCINPAITYGGIERLRVLLFQGRQVLKPWESFLLGMISKAIAIIALQPVSVAQTGLRSKHLPPSRNGKPFKSFGEVMAHIVETEGFLRLFKGLGPQLSKAILMQGLLNILKER